MNSKYDRSGLDSIMTDYYGGKNVEDAITDEVLIVAYEYNSQQPRFYSKYFTNQDPGIYNVTMGNATGASSAAPTFFDPKTIINPYELKEILIDGGLICNNPTLYAFQIATILRNEKNVRILSIGTGEKPFKPVSRAYTKYDWITKFSADEFTMNMDVYTAHNYLKNMFNHVYIMPENYIRL